MFQNPVWHALQTTQRRFAVSAGKACKFPGEVLPFGAVAENSEAALEDLASLLEVKAAIYLVGDRPAAVPGLRWKDSFPMLQMSYPEGGAAVAADAELASKSESKWAAESGVEIVPLSCADSPAMVKLKAIAFPGFFGMRTCELGNYYGIWIEEKLVAMAGERLKFGPYRELSGVCTHPAHTGKGFAGRLISRVLRDHAENGFLSWLHVASSNHHAIELYKRMGFCVSNELELHRLVRDE